MLTIFKVTNALNNDMGKTNCVYIKRYIGNYLEIINGNSKGIYKIIVDDTLHDGYIYLNSFQRMFLNCTIEQDIITTVISLLPTVKKITFMVSPIIKKKYDVNEKTTVLIRTSLINIPINLNQSYIFDQLTLLTLTIENEENAIVNMLNISSSLNKAGIINEKTGIELISTDENINLSTSTGPIFKNKLNFEDIGVGGLSNQFEIIFRRVFSSRVIPEKIIKNLGINHVRGLLLHGPPGTGKTMIARQLGKMLDCVEPKIVNGPSLLNKYIGASEENVRQLFADAIADKNGKKIHLIICDEFDAIAKKRGSDSGDLGVGDKVVNQFLTMIDGPNSLNNILLICMTNRKDLIDEALLRPGRLEVQIEISLPNETGRLEILKIHTKKMLAAGYINDVNLEELAKITINFTGAELESIVKNACSYAIAKQVNPNNLSNVNSIVMTLTNDDFIKAYKETKPLFGNVSNQIEIITSNKFELYSDEYSNIYNDILGNIKNSRKGKLISFLITGEKYVGKTTLACQIAKESQISCVKFINSETLVNNNYKEKLIYDIFDAGYKSDSFILILDSIEKIIEYSKLANIYNNKNLQIIYTLLDKIIDTNKSVIVLLTSSNTDLMELLDFNNICNFSYVINDIDNQAEIFKKK